MSDRRVMPIRATGNMINAAYMLIETMPHNTPERCKKLVAAIWEEMAGVAPSAKTSGLTPLQMRTHEIIADWIKERGIAPSYDEIGEQIGKDKSQVHRMLKGMKRRGILTWREGHRRSLRLIVQPGEPVNDERQKKPTA